MSLRPLKKFTASPELEAAIGHCYSSDELSLIDRLGTTTRIPAGQRFVTEGAFGREAVIILDGTASILHSDIDGDTDGNTVEIATAGPGDMVGEVALLHGQRRNATVVATTDLRVVVFNVREFRSLLDQAPRISSEASVLAEQRADH